jgi:hypothetical protein
MSTSPPGVRTATGLLPPEQRFWQRYSPHHEAPLSGASSFALHLAIVGVLILAGYVGWLGINARPSQPAVDAVIGSPGEQNATAPPAGDNGPPREAAAGIPDGVPKAPVRPEMPDLAPVRPQAKPDVGPAPRRPIRVDDFDDVGKRLEGLRQLGLPSGKAERQPGTPDGTGDKPGGQPGSLHNTPVPRALRWDLRFNTHDGRDYVRQLQGLGAVLAIPTGSGEAGYKVVRELSRRPTQLLDEDVSRIPGIRWRDEEPLSVAGVMQALGLNVRPSHFVAFMPPELEDKLARLEREFAGRGENQIGRTRFRVIVSRGKYDVEVIDQEPLR